MLKSNNYGILLSIYTINLLTAVMMGGAYCGRSLQLWVTWQAQSMNQDWLMD